MIDDIGNSQILVLGGSVNCIQFESTVSWACSETSWFRRSSPRTHLLPHWTHLPERCWTWTNCCIPLKSWRLWKSYSGFGSSMWTAAQDLFAYTTSILGQRRIENVRKVESKVKYIKIVRLDRQNWFCMFVCVYECMSVCVYLRTTEITPSFLEIHHRFKRHPTRHRLSVNVEQNYSDCGV